MLLTPLRLRASRLFVLPVLFACTILACNAPDLLSGQGERPAVADPSSAAAGAQASGNTDPADQIASDPLVTALRTQFGEDAAELAVLAAMGRGYAYNQIEAGILSSRLQANGFIAAAGGGNLKPSMSPSTWVDLSGLDEASAPAPHWADLALKPVEVRARQATSVDPETLLEYMRESFRGIGDNTDDLEYYIVFALLNLGRTGYTADQITEALLFNSRADVFAYTRPGATELRCAVLFDNEDLPIWPEIDTDCRKGLAADGDLSRELDDEYLNETDTETVAEPRAEDEKEGDVGEFCDIYRAYIDDLLQRADAIGDYYAECGGDCSAETLYREAEAAGLTYYQQMLDPAPGYLVERLERVTTTTLDGLYSSETTNELLEADMESIDATAEVMCGYSLSTADGE